MGSLGGCLKRLGFSADEGTHIRRLVKAYRDDGVSGPEATIKAVEDLIRDTEQELTAVHQQIEQGTVAEAAAPYGPKWYFQLERVLTQKMPNKASAEQVKGIVNAGGVKADEMKWTGLDDYLKTKDFFTKQEVMDFIKANAVQIEEVPKENEPDFTKFAAYNLPGGENLRGVLLTLRKKGIAEGMAQENIKRFGTTDTTQWPEPDQRAYWDQVSDETQGVGQFTGGHWAERDVVAHLRVNDRTDADGKKVLFLEEVQSDWHQKGKKEGYKDPQAQAKLDQLKAEQEQLRREKYTAKDDADLERIVTRHSDINDEMNAIHDATRGGVPDAPFKKTWHELAMRTALRMAAEGGYDKLAWVTGAQTQDRYDLSKQVDSINIGRHHGGEYFVEAFRDDNRVITKGGLDEKQLEETVGKDLAKKAIAELKAEEFLTAHQGGAYKKYKGTDLKVGGEWAIKLYDEMLPQYMAKLGKKWGAAVGTTKIPTKKGKSEIVRALERLDDLGFDTTTQALRAIRQHPTDWAERWDVPSAEDQRIINQWLTDPASVYERPTNTETVHSLDITPSMAHSVLTEGQALFERQQKYGRSPALRPNEDAKKTRQLSLFALGDLDRAGDDVSTATGAVDRPGTLPEEAETGRRGGQLPAHHDVRTVALGISTDLIHQGVVDLKGYLIRNASDLAKLAQVYRDPRFETFRIIYLKGQKIVGHEGLTSRLPGVAKILSPGAPELTQMRKTMESLGADGYWMLHNHPSGNSTPSLDDAVLTVRFEQNLEGYRGHVVIDSGEYSFFQQDPVKAPVKVPFKKGQKDELLTPSIPHALLGRTIFTDGDVAKIGRNLQTPQGWVTVLYRDNNGATRAIQEIPQSLLENAEEAGKFFKSQGVAFGSQSIFTHVKGAQIDPATIKTLIEDGYLMDHMEERVGRVVSARTAEIAVAAEANQKIFGVEQANLPSESVAEEQTSYIPEPPAKEPPPRKPKQTAMPIEPRPPDYPVPEPSRFDDLIRTWQDKHIDTKRLLQAIQATGRAIADETNPVLQEEMYQSRVMNQQKSALADEFEPLTKAMMLNVVTKAQVHDFAHARHAKEANARLKALNPDWEDNEALSGMTDEQADEILAAADRPKMDRIMRRVDDILSKTRQLMVDYGLETQKTIDAWTATYDFYVPLHREGFEEGMGTGQGKDVRGSGVRNRLGSNLPVSDILAQIMTDRDRIIAKGEKARVTTALAGMLMLNPNKQIASLVKPAPIEYTNPETGLKEVVSGDIGDYKVPRIRFLNKKTGEAEFRPDPNYKGRDNVLNFPVKGVPYAIVFNEREPIAMNIAKAMKDLDVGQLNRGMAAIAPVTRYIAQINTQWSPVFGVKNFIRDVQFAMLSLSSTPLAGKRAEVFKNTIKSMAGIYSDARAIRRGEPPSSATAALWEQFQHEGGPTGYLDLFRTNKDRAKQIEHLLDPHWWQKTTASKVLLANGLLNAPVAFAEEHVRKPLFNWLSDYNLMMENAVRLGVFKTALDQGISPIQAASLAKNITVNFNRKGQMSTQAGSLYAFFNASVQGTARMAETLFEPGKIGVPSRIGKKILAGGMLLGAMEAVAMALAGYDDDDPPEFVKQNNLIIPVPGTEKGFVMLPMPLGFNLIPTIGRLATETLIQTYQGNVKPGKKAYAALSAIMNIFSPVGTSTPLQTVLPSFLDPAAALIENKDWTGKTIAREDVSSLKPTPGFTRSKDSATPWARALAEALNYATGGTQFAPGAVSPTPDQIDYLIAQATGGVGRELSKLAAVAKGASTGESVPLYKTPLLGQLAGQAGGDASVREKFFNNLRELNIAEEELKGRARTKGDVTGYLKEHPEARLFPMGDAMQRSVATLQKRKHELVKQGAPKERVQLLEMQITALERRLNDRIAAAVR